MRPQIQRVEPGSTAYPSRVLGYGTQPTAISVLGDVDALNVELAGFLCSRRCPGEVILRTYELARAMRDAGVPMVGGFHSPMEKECLDILLRGSQLVVVCPARAIDDMRVPATWRGPLEEGRLTVVSPFEARHKRMTAALAEERNRFVAGLSAALVVPHAEVAGRVEALCTEAIQAGLRIHTLNVPSSANLVALGASAYSARELAGLLSRGC